MVHGRLSTLKSVLLLKYACLLKLCAIMAEIYIKLLNMRLVAGTDDTSHLAPASVCLFYFCPAVY